MTALDESVRRIPTYEKKIQGKLFIMSILCFMMFQRLPEAKIARIKLTERLNIMFCSTSHRTVDSVIESSLRCPLVLFRHVSNGLYWKIKKNVVQRFCYQTHTRRHSHRPIGFSVRIYQVTGYLRFSILITIFHLGCQHGHFRGGAPPVPQQIEILHNRLSVQTDVVPLKLIGKIGCFFVYGWVLLWFGLGCCDVLFQVRMLVKRW